MGEPPYAIVLTDGAMDDLQIIHRYMVEHRSQVDADRLLDQLVERMTTLRQFPLRGGIPSELGALGVHAYRQLLHSPYRIFYHVVETRIDVLLIADSRRDMQALLERRLLSR